MSNIAHALKIKSTTDSKVYFSSDFHLGHDRPFVWESRGHVSQEAHTDFVINKVNETIRPTDHLFYLGDFCLNTNEDQFESYLSRILCQNVYMLWGNHNNPVYKIYQREVLSKYGENIKVYPFRYRNVVFLGDYQEALIDGKIVVMMHYPINVWNFMKEGAYMLCGHSHYSFDKTRADSKQGLILDVGWDGKSSPYSTDEIDEIMLRKSIKVVDHHGDITRSHKES